MSDVVRSVTVKVRGDISGLERAYDRGGAKTDEFANKLERAGENSRIVNERQKELGETLTSNSRRLTTYNRNLDKMGSSSSSAQSKVQRLSNETATLDRRTTSLGSNMGRSGNQIDRYSGRLTLLLQAAVALGPGLIAGGTVPLAGLFAQAGATGVGLAVLIGSFQGVKDAVTAMNKAALDPSIANLQAEKQALDGLSPAAQDMAKAIATNAIPALKQLRDEGATATFPGLIEGAKEASDRLPQVQQLIHGVGDELGDLAVRGGKALSGQDWDKAFNYGIAKTPGLLDDAATSVGNLTLAAANLWVALDPLTQDFSGGLVDWTEKIADGSKNLDDNKGFQEFLSYAEKVGPEVTDTLGDIVNMLVQVGEAGAPISGPLIKALGAVASIVANIADSDIGTPLVAGALAMTAYGKATDLAARAQLKLQAASSGGKLGGSLKSLPADIRTATSLPRIRERFGAPTAAELDAQSMAAGRLRNNLGQLGKGVALVGAVTIAASGLGDKLGTANTASLALAGTLYGPLGAAAGATAGYFLDIKKSLGELPEAGDAFEAAFNDPKASIEDQRAALAAYNATISDTAASWGHVPSLLVPVKGQITAVTGIWNTLTGKTSDAEKAATSAYRSMVFDQVGQGITTGMSQAAASTEMLAHGFILTAQGADIVTESTSKFEAQLESLTNALAVHSSLTSYKSALLDIADALKKNGSTLDTNTRAGLANRQSLEQLASTALARAKDMEDAGNRTGSIRFMANAQKDLYNAARAFGMPKAAAARLARQLLDLGAISADPTITLKGALAAHAAVAAVASALAALPKDKFIGIHIVRSGADVAGLVGSARGNFFRHQYANGGMDIANRHQPEIAAGGTPYRVWAEPETGGEAYIPLANDSRRPRAKEITALTANALGGSVSWNATGSFTGTDYVPGYNAAQDAQQIQQTLNQIHDLTVSLGKTGKKRLKGGARAQAEDDLAAANAELAYLRNKAYYDKLADDAAAAQQAIDDANAAALQAADTLTQNRQSSYTSLTSTDLFARGATASGVTSSVDRLEKDIENYTNVLYSLKQSGASPALLKLVISRAEQGDFTSAVRLGKSLLANPLTLGTLNASLDRLSTAATTAADLSNDPSFLSMGAYTGSFVGGAVQISQSVQVDINADPTIGMRDLRNMVGEIVTTQLEQLANRR
ncbi:MAG: hypothetical protein JWQ74_439 [Marmoricola sp.]|nr:hypothetical protein [Marmoricola sp.]